jgi:Uma2 family endonuclease
MALETKPEIAEQLKPAKLRMSLQEFLEWADEDVWAEWEDGEVIFLSPASYRHQSISRFLTMLIGSFLEERDMGEVLTAPFSMWLTVSKRVREPDILKVSGSMSTGSGSRPCRRFRKFCAKR